MDRPLQVYLDSSDFSRFGDMLIGKGRSDDAQVFTRLEALVHAGSIECRYSYVHVSEAAPLRADDLPMSQSRAEAIIRLCGSRVLVPYFALPVVDYLGELHESDVAPVKRERFHARRDDGRWLPSFEKTFEEMRVELNESLNSPTKVLEREMRGMNLTREMKSRVKYLASHGLFKAAFPKFLEQEWPTAQATLRRKFPITAKTSDAWYAMMLGQKGPSEVANLVAEDLADLPALMQWACPGSESALTQFPQWIREPGIRFVAMLRDLAPNSDAMRRRFRGTGRDGASVIMEQWRQSHRENIEKFTTQLMAHANRQLRDDNCQVPDYEIDAIDASRLRNLPSVRALSFLYEGYLPKHTKPDEMARSPDKAASDFGDLLHGAYLPYVDVMRADGFSYGYFKPAGDKFGTRVVQKLHQLSAALDEELRKR